MSKNQKYLNTPARTAAAAATAPAAQAPVAPVVPAAASVAPPATAPVASITPLPSVPSAPPAHQAQVPAPATDAPAQFLAYDECATTQPRTHEMIVKGRKVLYTFQDYNTPVQVPLEVAVRLAGIDGFRVTDAAGNPFKIAKRNNEPVVLQPGEIIATYAELTYEALTNRTKMAGGIITGKPKAEELIAYLMSQGDKSPAAKKEAADDSELDLEEDED